MRIFGPADRQRQVGVVSLTVDGYDPQEMAAALDAAARVQVRAGLHCAPRCTGRWARSSGRHDSRSLGPFNTAEDVDTAVAAVREMASASTIGHSGH